VKKGIGYSLPSSHNTFKCHSLWRRFLAAVVVHISLEEVLEVLSWTALVIQHWMICKLICQIPTEKLRSRLIVNQDKRMELMDKREEMRTRGEDDSEDEDPDMVDSQM
jgi:hypothetical protein